MFEEGSQKMCDMKDSEKILSMGSKLRKWVNWEKRDCEKALWGPISVYSK